MNELVERQGRVVNADGVPLSGVPIVIAASTIPMPEIALLSDDDGQFVLRLPPGHFLLRAHGPDGTTGEAEVEGAPNTDAIIIMIGR